MSVINKIMLIIVVSATDKNSPIVITDGFDVIVEKFFVNDNVDDELRFDNLSIV
ncbi:hypothetical protein Smp_193890 [Schistosoma mansoni]|uniref:hypothetical protein n=1 Tax=Schistosoma mansoni TaxID=6183 RepID=UPI00022DC95B|nr:hypothetical protein Smp_193890 [Schistosoma mansoni]|eukprot:XP_018647641.1 hypothetical protein Smp_193890 [Schistosoma mansoni]